jgi:RNA polymerase primary sigma factor
MRDRLAHRYQRKMGRPAHDGRAGAPDHVVMSASSGDRAAAPSPARERRLVLLAKAPDEEARQALVEAFLPLIGSVARRYAPVASVTRDELMQAGVLGLLRALDRYDPALGTPFWAYASWWVRQAMQRLVSELAWPIVLSDRALRELARLKAVEHEAERDHGGRLSAGQLADRAGLGRDHVEGLMAARRAPRDGGVVVDRLPDWDAEDAYDRVERHLDALSLLEHTVAELDEREQIVVRGRFGFDGAEQTLGGIADTLGVSAERVRQIESEALDKLRESARVQ